METLKRTRQVRDAVPASSLVIQGEVDPGQVPQRSRQGRKWQDLARDVISTSRRGRWLVATLPDGFDPDVVRSGLKEELKRDHARLEWRLVRHDDQSITLYFFAKEEVNAP